MKRSLLASTIFLLTLLALASAAPAGETTPDNDLFPVMVDGKWGYINRNGEIVIKPRYGSRFGHLEPFYQGLARVDLDGKAGFIDTSGDIVIPPRYNYADTFEHGPACVTVDNLWGFIDPSGTELVPIKYETARQFSEGIGAWMEAGTWHFIDPEATELFTLRAEAVMNFYDGLAAFKRDGKWGYLDHRGEVVIQPQYRYADRFRNGRAGVIEFGPDSGEDEMTVWGPKVFIDRRGDKLPEDAIEEYSPFSDGLAKALGDNGLLGYVDERREWAIPPQFQAVSYFHDGRAVVTLQEGRLAVIDKQGNVVKKGSSELKGDVLFEDWYGGLAKVVVPERAGYITEAGELVELPGCELIKAAGEGMYLEQRGYDYPKESRLLDSSMRPATDWKSGLRIYDDFVDGLAPAEQWDKGVGLSGFVDSTLDFVIEPQFDYVSQFSEGLALFEQNQRYGYLNRDGTLALEPRYENAFDFHQGRARVKLNGLYGFIDTGGDPVAPCIYENARIFEHDRAAVKLTGKWGFIDLSGELAIPCQFDDSRNFSEGLAAVKLNDKWGYVSQRGITVIAFTLENASHFREGLALTVVDDKVGYINRLGGVVIPPRWDGGLFFLNGRAGVEMKVETDSQTGKTGRWGLIDKKGDIIVQPKYRSLMISANGIVAGKTGESRYTARWEFLDADTGELIASHVLDKVDLFRDGKAPVTIPWRVAYIDIDANVIWPPTH